MPNVADMNYSIPSSAGRNPRPHPRKLSRDTVFLFGDLLPLFDFTAVLLAAYLGALAYANGIHPGMPPAGILDDLGRAALAAALLAPFILCDRTFVSFASGSQTAALIRCFAVRFLMFVGAVVAIGLASHSLESLPRTWLGLWLACSLLLTVITRMLLIWNLRRLERKGILTETIAVAGAGPAADQLIRYLRQTRGGSVEILGVFDDRMTRGADCAHPPAGSLADLITLGQTHSIDWILLTPPCSADSRLHALVHRLKAIAVPIGLCPQYLGPELPLHKVRYLGSGLPVMLLADRPHTAWAPARIAIETVLPRWIVTLLSLPLDALRLLFSALPKAVAPARPAKLTVALDDYDLERFTEIAARFGQKRFGYVVNPNTDHLIRLHRDPAFRTLYADAAYVLLDSRFISHLLRFNGTLRWPVCTGSDITEKLLDNVILSDDRLVLIGGDAGQAARLRQRYGLNQLAHFNPKMGFIQDAAEVETCLQFIEAHSPFRYCLLAVGAPQQEIVAHHLKARGIARGLALCIGASINFLTGTEHRAPHWLRHCGMEWLYRLLQAPGRMAERYLVRGPQIFGLLRRTEIVLRPAIELPQMLVPSNVPAVVIPRRAPATAARKFNRERRNAAGASRQAPTLHEVAGL